MDLETKVERISDEFKSIRDELGQTRADLRAMLDMMGGSSSHDGPADSPPEEPGPSPEAPEGGGLALSQGELAGVLAGASSVRSSDNGEGLESIARSIREARSAGSGGPEMHMSLSDLAQMMKGLTSEMGPQSATVAPPNGASKANGHKKGLSNGNSKRRGASGSPSLKELARMMQSARSNGRPAVGSNRPKAVRPARPDASATPRRAVSPKGHDVLDVNLVANLIRWVGNVKRRLGVKHLQEVLELYQVTGHMPPVVEETVYRVARFSFVPDESDKHKTTHEDLIDAIQGLHGIVYGSGAAPVGPAVDFDIRETRVDAIVAEARVEEASPSTDVEMLDVEQGLPPEYERALAAFKTAVENPAVKENKPRPPVVGQPAPEVEAPEVPVVEPKPKTPIPVAEAAPVPVAEHSTHSNVVVPSHEAVTPTTRYPSDLTDTEWERIEALVPKQKPGGRPCKYDRREIVNGILYQMRNECSWRSLPANLPPWKIVHHYYRTWREDGTWESVYDALTGVETETESETTRSWDLSMLTNGRGADTGRVSRRPAMAETT